MSEDDAEVERAIPGDAPVFARIVRDLATEWPNWRVTEHTAPNGRRYTLIEHDPGEGDFDPTVPGDFVEFVENRPELPDTAVMEANDAE